MSAKGTTKIWQSFQLSSSLTMKNRIAMAPLTRCFAEKDLTPSKLAIKYYSDRADCGLIISEGTIVDPMAQGYPRTPGIYNQKQIEAWKLITKEVHKNGGLFFMQLWHTGRVSHPFYLSGQDPVSASAAPLEGKVPRTKDLEYGTPRALTTGEVRQLTLQFKTAAERAMESGCDGVEIHGANGYLLDQFLRQITNFREDEYGGSTENRARMVIELVDHVIASIGADRVGIRLSPGAYVNMSHTQGDEQTFIYLLKELQNRNLAYVHLGIFDDATLFEELGNIKASAFLRKHYLGKLMSSGSYSLNSAATALDQGEFDLVSLGRAFIANSDLVAKLQSGETPKSYSNDLLTAL